MLGERSDQRGLWEADRLYLDHVGRESFYGLLASLRGRLFRDAEFAEFYCPDNGRDSVPPSLLATALLLQSHDKVRRQTREMFVPLSHAATSARPSGGNRRVERKAH